MWSPRQTVDLREPRVLSRTSTIYRPLHLQHTDHRRWPPSYYSARMVHVLCSSPMPASTMLLLLLSASKASSAYPGQVHACSCGRGANLASSPASHFGSSCATGREFARLAAIGFPRRTAWIARIHV
ncbi:uncharacterized protein K460DRAFT_172293 [Cucurbitaria berberidis CBS 394.84]|uniref:Uncharacterized protein n=1 Tax=Cucurbitaria berberidis CBS 394.84 TaxID=1168544 RepID=A0A9P4GAK5_9PLEO|nr:uncharacterized protein K460DRAFT_172293 [Cucurbitaria berberidis CBS 394.84]KAF1841734.1 hypothetical protein K460DRAFT_172293 [Cucurbitaria berberidis CBS 394.84]